MEALGVGYFLLTNVIVRNPVPTPQSSFFCHLPGPGLALLLSLMFAVMPLHLVICLGLKGEVLRALCVVAEQASKDR